MATSKIHTQSLVRFLFPVLMIGILALLPAFSVRATGIDPTEVVKLTNEARAKEGLPALRENALLSQAAAAKARDMLKRDYFAHTSPSGLTPWSWIKGVGYGYAAAGENLAMNYSSAKEEQAAWMKSSTHRANILKTEYQEMGVAVVEGKLDGDTTLVTVVFFAKPAAAFADSVKKEAVALKQPAVEGAQALEDTLLSVVPPRTLVQEVAPLVDRVSEIPRSTVSAMEASPISVLDFGWSLALLLITLSLVLGPVVFVGNATYAWATYLREQRVPIHIENEPVSDEVDTPKQWKRLKPSKKKKVLPKLPLLVDGIALKQTRSP